MIETEETRKFKKLFENLAYTQSYHTVFDDFLEYSLIMTKWWDRKAEDFSELEKRWTKPEEHKAFCEMFLLYGAIAEYDGKGFYDGLGDLFMDLISHGRAGQFFTPMEICDMMAMMNIGDSAKDGMTICDPTCGSGRMLLTAAKLNRNMVFYGADIDLICCKMTVLNMMLNSMEGEIAWMDTLRMEHWKSWHIKKVLGPDNHYLPYYYTTGPGHTSFINRLRASLEDMKEAKQIEPEDKKQQLLLF